jgi:hypothetical protein
MTTPRIQFSLSGQEPPDPVLQRLLLDAQRTYSREICRRAAATGRALAADNCWWLRMAPGERRLADAVRRDTGEDVPEGLE